MGIFPDYLEDKSIFDEKEFFDGNRFKFYEFALFLYEEFHGCYIDNRPHVFTGKKYEPLNIDVVRKMTIKYIPSLREQQNKEVYQKLKTLCMNNYQEQCSARYIGLKNGIYDTIEEKLNSFSPDRKSVV